jgi:hypothetical protein
MRNRKIDLDMARKFLATLAPDANSYVFQTYNDRKVSGRPDPYANVIGQPFARCVKLLAEMNAKGAAVCVAINELDGRGRKRENFKRFRAVYADMDAKTCETTTPKWPLPPSIVVASNGGENRHVYWLISGEMDEATWQGIGARLVQSYGADKNAMEPVRVLRLPGFFHCKGAPARVKLLQCSGKRYTAAQLVNAFPPIKRHAKPHRSRGALPPMYVDHGALRSALGHLADTPHPRSREDATFVDYYDSWLRFGIALKRDLGNEGFQFWDEWSQLSDTYPGRAAIRAKWDGFDIEARSADAIHIRSIFFEAAQHGWCRVKYLGTLRGRGAKGAAGIRTL